MSAWRREEIIGDARLLLGDCREILPELQFDCILSDPPYGIGKVQSGGGKGIWAARNSGEIIGNDQPFDPRWIAESSADLILWGANHYAHLLPSSGGWLIWDKKLGLKEDDFSDGEAAWHKRGTRLRIYRQLWNGLLAHERGEKRQHIAQKPVALMEWCIGFVRGETILDPYMGSGTTGIACSNAGLRFTGIEIDPQHFATACRRIDAAQRQGRLFDAPKPSCHQPRLF